jgi:hypothetical protein
VTHPATEKFPPVAKLTDDQLRAIIRAAEQRNASVLFWTPREREAKRELRRRWE